MEYLNSLWPNDVICQHHECVMTIPGSWYPTDISYDYHLASCALSNPKSYRQMSISNHVWIILVITKCCGVRLTKAYDVTIQRYRKSHTQVKVGKIVYFAVYGFKIHFIQNSESIRRKICKFTDFSFEISNKVLNPYTAKFYELLKISRITACQWRDIPWHTTLKQQILLKWNTEHLTRNHKA